VGDRDRRLAGYLRRDVAAHSAHHRRVLETLGGRKMRSREDLSRLPLTVLAEVDDPAALVLRPTWSTLSRSGARRFAARLLLLRVIGRRSTAGRLVERAYKPVHWLLQEGIPVGSSETSRQLRREADEVVCVSTPDRFLAVGQAYADFSPTSDDEVRAVLEAFAPVSVKSPHRR
jgi:hypothetical protein